MYLLVSMKIKAFNDTCNYNYTIHVHVRTCTMYIVCMLLFQSTNISFFSECYIIAETCIEACTCTCTCTCDYCIHLYTDVHVLL